MRIFHWACLCLLGVVFLTGAATTANADAWNKRTVVTISQSIEVPGAILPPGEYVFKLLDSPNNRHIVQIANAAETHVYTTNQVIPDERTGPTDKTLITFYEMPGGGPEPIHSWFYAGDSVGQEFTYPRQRAMEISQAMKQNVPALAELRRPAAASATSETTAPAAEPAAEPAIATTPATDAASTAEEPAPAADTSPSTEATTSEPTPADQPPQDRAAAQPPAAGAGDAPAEPKMPTTAGNTAEIGLFGLCSMGLAASIRLALRRAGSK